MSEDRAPESVGADPAPPPPQHAAPATAPSPPASAVPPLWSRIGTGLNPAMMVALVALALSIWQWATAERDAARLQNELARRLATAEAAGNEVRSGSDRMRNDLRDLESRLGLMEAKLIESQNQRLALESLYQELARNRDEWVLAEIEQLLIAANQQLQLAGNVRAAILALQNADARLQRIDRPQLAPLRKVIERDIELLRVSPFVDVVGLSLKIENVIEAVGTASLAMQQRPAEQTQSAAPGEAGEAAYVRLAREIWADLRSLERIQNVDRPEPPLLDPGQAFFLRENVKLRLLNARLALLSRQYDIAQADLRDAQSMIERYFDRNSRRVTAASEQVRQLAAQARQVALPRPDATLAALATAVAGR